MLNMKRNTRFDDAPRLDAPCRGRRRGRWPPKQRHARYKYSICYVRPLDSFRRRLILGFYEGVGLYEQWPSTLHPAQRLPLPLPPLSLKSAKHLAHRRRTCSSPSTALRGWTSNTWTKRCMCFFPIDDERVYFEKSRKEIVREGWFISLQMLVGMIQRSNYPFPWV